MYQNKSNLLVDIKILFESWNSAFVLSPLQSDTLTRRKLFAAQTRQLFLRTKCHEFGPSFASGM